MRINIRGGDPGGYVAGAQRRLQREFQLPPGYKIAWGGQFENPARARVRPGWIVPAAIVALWLRGIHLGVPAEVHGAGTQFRACLMPDSHPMLS